MSFSYDFKRIEIHFLYDVRRIELRFSHHTLSKTEIHFFEKRNQENKIRFCYDVRRVEIRFPYGAGRIELRFSFVVSMTPTTLGKLTHAFSTTSRDLTYTFHAML